MITSTCGNCKEIYEYEISICPGCQNETFDVEELSDCCSAPLIGEIGICSDCKEGCK